MKTIYFAAEANVSDIFSSVNIRDIVNTFSYNCEKMYMYMLFWKKIRKFNNPLRFRTFRALYGILLRVMFSEKVHEVWWRSTFVKNVTIHALSANDIA